VQVRISAAEFAEGGRTLFESHQIFRNIEEWGADSIHITYGMYGTRSSTGSVSSFYQSHGWNVGLAAEVKSLVRIPVITVGRISDPIMAEEIIASGKADFVAMGRQSLTDPHYPNKVKSGNWSEIRQCIGCLQGCTASTDQGVPVYCLVNPELGHEFEADYSAAPARKKVFVAGGGVAGMEAARGAAIKGHEVHLYESSGQLGGQFVSAAYPPFKGEFATYPAWLLRQLNKLGVNTHTGTPLTKDTVIAGKPDKVIIASGAKPVIPDIPGIGLPNVVLAEDVLRGRSDTGLNVLVAGGGMIGAETASYLATQCKAGVGLVEMRPDIGMDMEGGIKDDLKDVLNKYFVKILTDTTVVSITDNGAVLRFRDSEYFYPCDTVVLAVGTESYAPLAEELKGICETVTVGDAKEARKAIQATREGFVAGLNA
jgi:NADPH-dependent 2,4-dienoyl-CoA reductase/sulfur reductase-like enzyme